MDSATPCVTSCHIGPEYMGTKRRPMKKGGGGGGGGGKAGKGAERSHPAPRQRRTERHAASSSLDFHFLPPPLFFIQYPVPAEKQTRNRMAFFLGCFQTVSLGFHNTGSLAFLGTFCFGQTPNPRGKKRRSRFVCAWLSWVLCVPG
jgi:hypothetical protein